ncbi:MAG: hypothetical protein ACOYL5_17445, partial [Phototrophicaceae bacterium]
MRRWQLEAHHPRALWIAADARHSETDYINDHCWELLLDRSDDMPLALQTRYGGRIGLARIAPVWRVNGKRIQKLADYPTPLSVTAFSPDYLQVETTLAPEVFLQAELHTPESHALMGRYTIENRGSKPLTLQLDLFAYAFESTREQQIALLTLENDTYGLSMGKLQNIYPVVLLKDARAELEAVRGKNSPPITRTLTLAAGE